MRKYFSKLISLKDCAKAFLRLVATANSKIANRLKDFFAIKKQST